MRRFTLVTSILITSTSINAQQAPTAAQKHIIDSIKKVRIDEAALMYPVIRQFSISHQETLPGKMSSKLYGSDLFKARFRSGRTTINMNMPILSRKNDALITSLGVVHQFFGIREVESFSPDHEVNATDQYNPMIKLAMTYTHRDTLFGRPVSFTASVNGLFNPEFSSRQLNYTGIISTPLIRKENTSLTGGVIINIDPSSPAPAFLFVSYFHRFKSLNLELMADLPSRFALRKPLSSKTSLSLQSELVGSNSFFDLNSAGTTLPNKLTYSTLEIKSGVLFEYRLTGRAVLSLSGGLNSTVQSKILEQGAKPNDYIIKNKNATAPYGQIGISLLPFWKGLNL